MNQQQVTVKYLKRTATLVPLNDVQVDAHHWYNYRS
jgi:hypothetical protein